MILQELDLKNLGFEKVKVPIEESGDKPYYYYTLDIGNDYRKFCLISDAMYKLGDDIIIKIFDYDSFVFTETTELTLLINILQNNISKQKI